MLRYNEAKQTEISELGAEKVFFAGPFEENKRPEPPNTPNSKSFSKAFSKTKRGQGEVGCCKLTGVRILCFCSRPGRSAQDAPINQRQMLLCFATFNLHMNGRMLHS